MEQLSPTEWVEKIYRDFVLTDFPYYKYNKSCLIYSKRDYGIFLLEDKNNEKFTVKVKSGYLLDKEEIIALYVKHFASQIPNLLHVENIYRGVHPRLMNLFTKTEKIDITCKDTNVKNIFSMIETVFLYYVTKACNYNLGYYFGPKVNGTLTYDAFVSFSFQLTVALQSLHRLGVWHRDIKPANILVCDSSIAKNNRYIRYNYNNEKTWTLSYDVLNDRDFKIIDYGESQVLNDVNEPCNTFTHEVSIGFYNVIILMWKKVTDKKNEDLYNDFIFRLKTCNTNLNDIMLEAPIFDELAKKYTDVPAYEVNLLPY